MRARYPERIVCLTEETTETLYLLGEQRRIVGISGYTVRPPQARRDKPKVSAFLSAKTDKIVDLRPDLVLGFSDLQADIARELAKAGLNVVIFNQRSVDEILSMILTLSAMVGAADKGRRLIEQLENGLESIKLAAQRFPRRARVYFEEWDEPMISAIRWVSELVGIAGGEDVFAELSVSQAAAGRTISDASLVISRKPDVIIGSWCGKKFRPERVAARAGWGRREVSDERESGPERKYDPDKVLGCLDRRFAPCPRALVELHLLAAVAFDFSLDPEKHFRPYRLRTGIAAPKTPGQRGEEEQGQRADNHDRRQKEEILRKEREPENMKAAVGKIEKQKLLAVPVQPENAVEQAKQNDHGEHAQGCVHAVHLAGIDAFALSVE